MNSEILDRYGITMRKTSEPFDAYVTGSFGPYLYTYLVPDNVARFISVIDLAIAGNFDTIDDPDWGGGISKDSYWNAEITPDNFEIWHETTNYDDRYIIPLEDMREILLAWKECLEG